MTKSMSLSEDCASLLYDHTKERCFTPLFWRNVFTSGDVIACIIVCLVSFISIIETSKTVYMYLLDANLQYKKRPMYMIEKSNHQIHSLLNENHLDYGLHVPNYSP